VSLLAFSKVNGRMRWIIQPPEEMGCKQPRSTECWILNIQWIERVSLLAILAVHVDF
jgi:hypothetical protein